MFCSNSLRSDDAEHNAVGLLNRDMLDLESLIMRAADRDRVPEGSGLSVDRAAFAGEAIREIEAHPNIRVVRERIDALPDHPTIIATGPLTDWLSASGGDGSGTWGRIRSLFFDAIAPIVESAAIGLLAARFAAAEMRGKSLESPPVETAMGALLGHITGGADADTFQPMNVNFGLMPPPEGRARKSDRRKAYTNRARTVFLNCLVSSEPDHAPLPGERQFLFEGDHSPELSNRDLVRSRAR